MKIRNPKAEELWYRTIIRKDFQELTAEYRKKINVPIKGLIDKSKVNMFFKNISKSKLQCIKEYIDKCEKNIRVPNEFGDYAMFIYLVRGEINVSNTNLTGCELSYESCNTDGPITLKIGINSSIKDIKRFVEEERRMIKYLQKKYREEHKLLPIKRIRTSPNKDRDSIIYHLAKYPKNKLYKILQKKDPEINYNLRKEDIIKRLLKKISDIETDPDVIRTVITRQKKLREKSM